MPPAVGHCAMRTGSLMTVGGVGRAHTVTAVT